MGLFSWNCLHCGHPMLSKYSSNEHNRWMEHVVVLRYSPTDPEDDDVRLPHGGLVFGRYDGYGSVSGVDIVPDNLEPSCFHIACWLAAGRPLACECSSESSADQGYFFDDPAHDMDPPVANWSEVIDDWLLHCVEDRKVVEHCKPAVKPHPTRVPPGVMV